MNSDNSPTNMFKAYAELQLKSHAAELETRYENESPDRDTLQKALDEHRKIYGKELDEKIKELTRGNDLNRGQLNAFKNQFIDRLSAVLNS